MYRVLLKKFESYMTKKKSLQTRNRKYFYYDNVLTKVYSKSNT